jgi:hypothetical protein
MGEGEETNGFKLGGLAAAWRRDRFRVSFFSFFTLRNCPPTLCEFFFPQKFKISPPLVIFFWLIFIGKMLLGSPNWSLIFFFLVNFDFSYFFCIS